MEDNRSLIIKRVSRWMAPFIFLYGVYLALYGHLSPGGGFPGGVVVAAAFILILLARGEPAALSKIPYAVAKELDALGALLFLGVGLAGIGVSGVFFANFIQEFLPGQPLEWFSGGTIIINNVAIAMKVAGSIFLVLYFLSVLRISGEGEVGFSSLEEK